MFQRNHLLDFENFLKNCPTERPANRCISRPAGREQLADCGSSSVITFWTLSKFQTISKSVVGRNRPIGVSIDRQVENDSPMGVSLDGPVEKDPQTRVSLVALSRKPSADEGFPTLMTSWTFKIFQSPQWKETHPLRSLDWQVENDSPIADLPA